MSDEESRGSERALKPLSRYDKADLVALLDRKSERLSSLGEKCWHLVWYARKDPGDPDPRLLQGMKKIEADYPTEVAQLAGKDGDCAHGFNSAVLATVRLLTAYVGELE